MENNEVITPIIVLLELSYKADKEKWNYKEILDFIKIHSKIAGINEEFVLNFGQLYNKTKESIKALDLQI